MREADEVVEGSTVEVPVVLVAVPEAAVAVQVSPHTIRSWAHRGFLERKGTRAGSGKPALYDLGQVYSVAAAFARGERPERVVPAREPGVQP